MLPCFNWVVTSIISIAIVTGKPDGRSSERAIVLGPYIAQLFN